MKVLTSEAVFRGHPDKICDQISDAIVDAYLRKDSESRVAIEVLMKNSLVVVAGEVTSTASIDYEKIVIRVLKELDYLNLDKVKVMVEVSKQSPDIALGVDKGGASDQGIMYGYATNETEELMPMPIVLARKIAIQMDKLSSERRDMFGSDGKCQVSVEYDGDIPKRVVTIVVSQQTKLGVERKDYVDVITNECINKVIPIGLMKETKILINPTGEFVKGGAYADCGVTGRKIVCDTYGGIGRIGGGAFSGKRPTMVDRLGAYYARYVAKNVVASGLASKCEVQVGYAIGINKPISVNVDTFGTSKMDDKQLLKIINLFFNFSPRAMYREIIDEDTCFEDLAKYGHIGRSDIQVLWERTNKARLLKLYAV